MFELLIRGIVIGLAVSAPIGPIGILCIQRSLQYGFKAGIVTGLGATSAETLYGSILALGLSITSPTLIAHQFWIKLIGGSILIFLGLRLFISSAPQRKEIRFPEKSLITTYCSTFLLTLVNPLSILSLVAIFASFGISKTHVRCLHMLWLIFGITLGAMIWWLFLSSSVSFILRHHITPSALRKINWISGTTLLMFAAYTLTA